MCGQKHFFRFSFPRLSCIGALGLCFPASRPENSIDCSGGSQRREPVDCFMEWKPVVFVLFPGRAGQRRNERHSGSESIPPRPVLSGCDSWTWNTDHARAHVQTHARSDRQTWWAPFLSPLRTCWYMWSTNKWSSNRNVSSLMHLVFSVFFFPFFLFYF